MGWGCLWQMWTERSTKSEKKLQNAVILKLINRFIKRRTHKKKTINSDVPQSLRSEHTAVKLDDVFNHIQLWFQLIMQVRICGWNLCIEPLNNNLNHFFMFSLSAQAGKAGYAEDKLVRWGEKGPARTLLCVADHHELLADVSTAVHWEEQLSYILFHRVGLFREEHGRLCFGEGEEQMRGVRGTKKPRRG